MSTLPQSMDFGESIVPLTGTDAFFLDTNILVAYFYEKHDKHLPCFCFISYLIKNSVILCTSEIVVVELLNTLARISYIDDEIQKHIGSNGEFSSNNEYRKMHSRFKGSWSGHVIKSDHTSLIHYNTLAANKIKSFINSMFLIPSSEEAIQDMLSQVTITPQASADAMIISSAVNFGCQFLMSLDSDMQQSQQIAVLSTVDKSEEYDVEDALTKFDILEYLYDEMGETDFNTKFPKVSIPVKTNN